MRLAITLSLLAAPLARAAEPQLLGQNQLYLYADSTRYTISALQLDGGARRLELSVGDGKRLLPFDNLLTTKTPDEGACTDPGYFVSIDVTENDVLSTHAAFAVTERLRMGHADDANHPCAAEVVRKYTVQVKKGGALTARAFGIESVTTDDYFGSYPYSIGYDFVRHQRLNGSEKVAVPAQCQLTLDELNRSLSPLSQGNPLGGVKACAARGTTLDLNAKESQALYRDFQLKPGAYVDGIECRTDEGEERRIRPRAGIIQDCHSGQAIFGGENSHSLSSSAVAALKHALIRTHRDLPYVHQDSLGSNNSWGPIRQLSCSSETSCWIEIDAGKPDWQ